jgi:hypothetical protein
LVDFRKLESKPKEFDVDIYSKNRNGDREADHILSSKALKMIGGNTEKGYTISILAEDHENFSPTHSNRQALEDTIYNGINLPIEEHTRLGEFETFKNLEQTLKGIKSDIELLDDIKRQQSLKRDGERFAKLKNILGVEDDDYATKAKMKDRNILIENKIEELENSYTEQNHAYKKLILKYEGKTGRPFIDSLAREVAIYRDIKTMIDEQNKKYDESLDRVEMLGAYCRLYKKNIENGIFRLDVNALTYNSDGNHNKKVCNPLHEALTYQEPKSNYCRIKVVNENDQEIENNIYRLPERLHKKAGKKMDEFFNKRLKKLSEGQFI